MLLYSAINIRKLRVCVKGHQNQNNFQTTRFLGSNMNKKNNKKINLYGSLYSKCIAMLEKLNQCHLKFNKTWIQETLYS